MNQYHILKQLTSSLIYPEKGLGKAFWARVYAEAQAAFGTTDIPVDTFNKVWIMPERAEVFEKGPAVYVTVAKLKVMLDSDRTAITQNASDAVTDEKAAIAKTMMREIVLPAIEKEVNEGRNFAAIRQVYHAAILAKWYRELIQHTLLADAYVGKNKVAGVTTDEKALKEEIYQRYIAAYRKGAFNYIKEEAAATGETRPRKYFSGGIEDFAMKSIPLARTTDAAAMSQPVGKMFRVDMSTGQPQGASMAMRVVKDAVYKDAVVDPGLAGADRDAKVDFVDVGKTTKLSFSSWDKRTSDPFTSQEQAAFKDPQFVSENLKAMRKENIKNIRQTIYNRVSGSVVIELIITDMNDEKHYYRLSGPTTSSVDALKKLITPLTEMVSPGAVLQASVGNQGDLPGNFTLTSMAGRWQLFGAADQTFERPYRVIVQHAAGSISLERIQVIRSVGMIKVYRVEGEVYRAADKELPADGIDFIMAAAPLLWEGKTGRELLEESYVDTSDFRHVFRFPKGIVFYDQVSQDGRKLRDAFNNKAIELRVDSRSDVDLLDNIGYARKSGEKDVTEPGDYWFSGHKMLRIILLPARYPLNALVIGKNGEKGFIEVKGESRERGANYWTVGEWIRQEVLKTFGWEPQAVFALDNGKDPTLALYQDGRPTYLIKGREAVNASLSVVHTAGDATVRQWYGAYVKEQLAQLSSTEAGRLIRDSWQTALSDPANVVLRSIIQLGQLGVSERRLKEMVRSLIGSGIDVTDPWGTNAQIRVLLDASPQLFGEDLTAYADKLSAGAAPADLQREPALAPDDIILGPGSTLLEIRSAYRSFMKYRKSRILAAGDLYTNVTASGIEADHFMKRLLKAVLGRIWRELGIPQDSEYFLYFREFKTFASDGDIFYIGPKQDEVLVRLMQVLNLLGVNMDDDSGFAIRQHVAKQDPLDMDVLGFFYNGNILEQPAGGFARYFAEKILKKGLVDMSWAMMHPYVARMTKIWSMGLEPGDKGEFERTDFKKVVFRPVMILLFGLAAKFKLRGYEVRGELMENLRPFLSADEVETLGTALAFANQSRSLYQIVSGERSRSGLRASDIDFIRQVMAGQGVSDHDAFMTDLGRKIEMIRLKYFGNDFTMGLTIPWITNKIASIASDDRPVQMLKAVMTENGFPDPAQAAEAQNGGIDLNADGISLQVKSGGIRFRFDPAVIERIRNASGLMPVIGDIRPIDGLLQFLGIRSSGALPAGGV